MSQDITERFEQAQYSAALAVTAAWRDTSRQRLLNELGWKTFTIEDGLGICVTV